MDPYSRLVLYSWYLGSLYCQHNQKRRPRALGLSKLRCLSVIFGMLPPLFSQSAHDAQEDSIVEEEGIENAGAAGPDNTVQPLEEEVVTAEQPPEPECIVAPAAPPDTVKARTASRLFVYHELLARRVQRPGVHRRNVLFVSAVVVNADESCAY